jgi:hypothetical protein
MGELEVGSHILIVDDVVTYGSTLAICAVGYRSRVRRSLVQQHWGRIRGNQASIARVDLRALSRKVPRPCGESCKRARLQESMFYKPRSSFSMRSQASRGIEDLVQAAVEMKQRRGFDNRYERDID